jgi:hypothetical protein
VTPPPQPSSRPNSPGELPWTLGTSPSIPDRPEPSA